MKTVPNLSAMYCKYGCLAIYFRATVREIEWFEFQSITYYSIISSELGVIGAPSERLSIPEVTILSPASNPSKT